MEQYLNQQIKRLEKEIAYHESLAKEAQTERQRNYNRGMANGYRMVLINMVKDLNKIS